MHVLLEQRFEQQSPSALHDSPFIVHEPIVAFALLFACVAAFFALFIKTEATSATTPRMTTKTTSISTESCPFIPPPMLILLPGIKFYLKQGAKCSGRDETCESRLSAQQIRPPHLCL